MKWAPFLSLLIASVTSLGVMVNWLYNPFKTRFEDYSRRLKKLEEKDSKHEHLFENDLEALKILMKETVHQGRLLNALLGYTRTILQHDLYGNNKEALGAANTEIFNLKVSKTDIEEFAKRYGILARSRPVHVDDDY
jgi:hypothetical protein